MAAPATTAVAAPNTATKKPDETSAFKQQRMVAWQPVMSPLCVIAIFISIAVAFIPIGAAVIVASDSIVEIVQRYDQLSNQLGANITLPIEIPQRMDPPIFIYYQLESFFQNHRRYAKSRSDPQLSGDLGASLTDCDPFTSPGQYLSNGSGMTVSLTSGSQVDVTSVTYLPCGLIAWSMFNDTFYLYANNASANLICDGSNFRADGTPIDPNKAPNCVKKGIAWPSDPGTKFVKPADPLPATITSGSRPTYLGGQGWGQWMNPPKTDERFCLEECAYNGWYIGERGHKIPLTNDEDLMVWMRVASLSQFRKLYRKITAPLPAGSYTVFALNNFPVTSFKGKKSFVLTTTSWIGGPNYILGGLYVATGLLSLLLGLGFLAKHLTTPRRVGAL